MISMKNRKMSRWYWLGIVGLIFCLLLSARSIIDGNVLFHSDIARDFWLIKEVVDTKKLTLIGPRSGGIEGMFHGPLWIYINIPGYILGQGNPVVVGWIWLSWHLFTILSVWWVGTKVGSKKVGILSALLYAAAAVTDPHSFNNPQGAIILFAWVFYFWYQFWQKNRTRDLLICLFLVGLTIQFQIAFGGPLLVLMLLAVLYRSVKSARFGNILAFLLLLLPLSSYLLFDVRHDFLQLHSLFSYIQAGGGDWWGWIVRIERRLVEMWLEGGTILVKNKVLSAAIFLGIVWSWWKGKNTWVGLYLYFYVGFWVLCIGFRGGVPIWYYSPFLPVLAIVFAMVMEKVRWGRWGWGLIFGMGLWIGVKDAVDYRPTSNWTSWRSMLAVAKTTDELCGESYGYFVYTADLYGYPLRYVMDYTQKQKGGRATLHKKMETTCLIMGPTVKENPNGRANWKSGDIKLFKEPVNRVEMGNGLTVEKYLLTKTEQEVETNPNMIKSIEFR